MRSRSLFLLVWLASVGCVVETVPCASVTTSPACPDGGRVDGGRDGGGDAAADGGGDAYRADTGADGGPCAACGGATPHCVADECVACADDDDCTGSSRCEPLRHECVACLGTAGDACPSATPVCDTSALECVGCLTSTDCTTVAASVCNTGSRTCEPCDAAGECAHLAATPACDLAASECVECLANADCAPTEGCDPATSACVAITLASAGPCDSCLRDTQCRAGQLCVPMRSGVTPVGNFCAWREDASSPGPAGSCLGVRPHVRAQMLTSVDGAAARVCTLRTSTCEAHDDFNVTSCTGPLTGTMASPMCGASMGATDVADGYCRVLSGPANRCTVECTTNEDCPCTDGSCAGQYTCVSGFCSLSDTCTWCPTMSACITTACP